VTQQTQTEQTPLISVTSVDSLSQECLGKIKTWYLMRKPYKWMCEELRNDGYLLNHTRLWHWCKNNMPGTGGKEAPPDLTEKDRLEVERQVVSSLLDMCGEAIRGITTPKISDVEDLNRLAAAVARLVASQVQRDRLEYDKAGALFQARDQLLREIKNALAGRPEIAAELHEIISGVAPEKMPDHLQ
jgi:hypothetical protein